MGASQPGRTAERVQAVLVVDRGTDLDDDRQAGQRRRSRITRKSAPRRSGPERSCRAPKARGSSNGASSRIGWPAGTGTPAPERPDRRARSHPWSQRFAPGRTIAPSTTIDELGLSSLERVELMMALEEALQVTLDEATFAAAATVGDLEALTRPLEAGERAGRDRDRRADRLPGLEPSAPVAWLRRASLPTWILPLARVFVQLRVEGLEHLERPGRAGDLRRQSPEPPGYAGDSAGAAAAVALPLAPAMAKEFFKAHFFPAAVQRPARG